MKIHLSLLSARPKIKAKNLIGNLKLRKSSIRKKEAQKIRSSTKILMISLAIRALLSPQLRILLLRPWLPIRIDQWLKWDSQRIFSHKTTPSMTEILIEWVASKRFGRMISHRDITILEELIHQWNRLNRCFQIPGLRSHHQTSQSISTVQNSKRQISSPKLPVASHWLTSLSILRSMLPDLSRISSRMDWLQLFSSKRVASREVTWSLVDHRPRCKELDSRWPPAMIRSLHSLISSTSIILQCTITQFLMLLFCQSRQEIQNILNGSRSKLDQKQASNGQLKQTIILGVSEAAQKTYTIII